MRPRTFSIQTLGCRVNQYEAEQLATLLQSRGLTPAGEAPADLTVVHTCSVTVQAASKSRQTARRATVSLPVLAAAETAVDPIGDAVQASGRLILTGCWATSDPTAARAIPGVDAIITHHDDVAGEIDRLLDAWEAHHAGGCAPGSSPDTEPLALSTDLRTQPGGTAPGVTRDTRSGTDQNPNVRGFPTLPLLGQHQTGRQRALLKVQDGCDAHCTYCIIPQLRPTLWSKPVDDAVEEARRLVDSGHVEIVLTGIFLGAYGHATALRRRQSVPHAETGAYPRRSGSTAAPASSPIASLIDALCTEVPGLRRLRLSSLEPGDLTPDLLSALRSHPQVLPHFHLPLQSGSDRLLRRMNRQYSRDDFLRMVDSVRQAFDRPALTTDVIAGFPGEDDAAFAETADLVRRAGFIHVHAFHFSPRPRTAAARWQKDFVRGPVVGQRVDALRAIADENNLRFRRSFVGQDVELLVEQDDSTHPTLRHGRCERYFDIWFEDAAARPGDFVRVRIDEATATRTRGCVVSNAGNLVP